MCLDLIDKEEELYNNLLSKYKNIYPDNKDYLQYNIDNLNLDLENNIQVNFEENDNFNCINKKLYNLIKNCSKSLKKDSDNMYKIQEELNNKEACINSEYSELDDEYKSLFNDLYNKYKSTIAINKNKLNDSTNLISNKKEKHTIINEYENYLNSSSNKLNCFKEFNYCKFT